MCIPQCLRRERGNLLAEGDIRIAERFGIALGAQEDRADHGAFPTDGHDDDRADVARVERRLDAAQRGVVCGIGNEDRLAAVERALQLGIAGEVDDEVPYGRILVAGDEAHFILVAREEDGAAIETERLAELPRNRLEDVDEVERRGRFLEDVDDGDEVVPFALEVDDARLQAQNVVS